MNENVKPTHEQIEALRQFAKANGRNWKSKLRQEWMSATASWPLMQVRNKLGPSWLVKFKLPNETVASETFRPDERAGILEALANLAQNQEDIAKGGEDANPAPYYEVASMIESGTFDSEKLTPEQFDAYIIAREEWEEQN